MACRWCAANRDVLHDMAKGGMPSMIDRKQFTIGKDIAATPGSVVYRDEMFELLQYTPATPKVHTIPVLMIPPRSTGTTSWISRRGGRWSSSPSPRASRCS